MSEPAPLREIAQVVADAGVAGLRAEEPGYAGRTRYTQLEYQALLDNASIGIAFTRERRFFLCNAKFAEMLGYEPQDLIGRPGEIVYTSAESYHALGRIAVPLLTAGKQVDLEWELRRKDGSTFLCRIIAKALDAQNMQHGTVWIAEDITERRRQADDVARLAREQEAILGTASIGIVFVQNRRIVRCNKRYEEMYGYGPGELKGKPTSMLYADPTDHQRAQQVYDILARGQTSRRSELRRRKDGGTFWTRADGRAVDPQDPHKGSVWIVEDVTESRKAADELQRVLAEQQALLNNVVVGIAFTRDRKVARCNRRFEEMFGYAPAAAIGASWRELYFTDEEYAERAAIYAELDEGRTPSRDAWLRKQDGSGFWCRVSARAVQPGDASRGYVFLLEDISERKRADEVLHRLLREQDAVLENALAGIIFVRDRRIVRSNRRFEELFGYEPGELIGQSTRFMFRSDEDYEAGGAVVYEAVWRGETQQLRREHQRKDGTRLWCSISGRAVQEGDPAQGSVWLFEDITRQHEAEERIERALAEQELILDNATVGIAFVRDRKIQRCNRYLEDMVGAGPGELVGESSSVLFADADDWERAGSLAHRTTAPGGAHDAEWRFRRRDGSTFRCRTRGRRIDVGEEMQEWIWSFEDVTAEREADLRVQRALAEQELILDNATVGIAFVKQRVYQRCNPTFEQMFGYGPGELIGRSTEEIYTTADEFAGDARWYDQMRDGQAITTERQYRRKDGSTFWCKLVGKAIDSDHPREGAIWIYDDVTAEHAARASLEASRDALERAVTERTAELEEAKARAQHLADHDALTGLPNRRLLEDRLTQALALSQRNRKQTAVMFIDLDRFKPINDSLGHAVGDVLLKEISQRLVNQLRVGDTICRIGGDEFVVVLPEVKRSSDVAQVAQKVIEQVSFPVTVDERELGVSCSIGITVFPDDGSDAESLIRNADAAMYHAKELGRANYQFFTEQMNQAASRRLALETDLRRALGKDELRVHYQRIVDAKSGKLRGHEALVRWQHPERGLVPPSEFIQIAEESGLILRIGEWVLRQACQWGKDVGAARDLQIAVNLSPRQFNDPKLAQMVTQALAETGLPPRLLELEITETLAMQHTDVTLTTLNRLKALGVSIAIDDFGTGYSSLAYLKRFPVDKVKIDRTFVADIPEDQEQGAIISAIVALAHALDIEVIAEGVENAAQHEFLRRCGCDFIQGYLIGRPQDADAASNSVPGT
ncbi:MAG TPA: PAS domain S-box protein [Burkholderiales bacterium]|nr:PAS domain S-box protein [Burkholderiales bacterium]